MQQRKQKVVTARLRKCPTGIRGLDEITDGGLPRGRPTLICGGPGCGKTLLSLEFIVRGIQQYGEPGAFVSFEETVDELVTNVASLGFDLNELITRGLLAVDYVHLERSEIEETGEYNLDGLFIRLESLIREVGAKRVGLDTLEALFAGLSNEGILRAELRRLFRKLKDWGVTSVVTAEQGRSTLTRHGFEEYVSDCVIVLDHRLANQVATRRLRIVKYRGSTHGTNEYPTAIDEHGLNVLPISSLGLTYPVARSRVSTGVKQLDEMMGGKGYYAGSSVLISGTSGTGKTSLAVAFADSLCRKGKKVLYFSFEESDDQIIRNMTSIGFDVAKWAKRGLLQFHCIRPTMYGLEAHLGRIHQAVATASPSGVVMDPVTSFTSIAEADDSKSMLTRLIDFLKNKGATTIFTSLTQGGAGWEKTDVGISSLMDTWLLLRSMESSSERNRVLYVLKSRGMAHSNQMREFILSERGIGLRDVYLGPGEVLTGAARMQQENRDRMQALVDEQAFHRQKRNIQEQKAILEAQIVALRHQIESIEQEGKESSREGLQRKTRLGDARKALSLSRSSGSNGGGA